MHSATYPTLMVERHPTPERQREPVQRVGDEELEQHIRDCEWLWQRSYDAFQKYGNPHDRDAALMHLHRMNEAILARSPAVQAARHAAFEQRLSEGVDYFQVQGAAAREALQGRAN